MVEIEGDPALAEAYNTRMAELEPAGLWRRDWAFDQRDVAVLDEYDDIEYSDHATGVATFTMEDLANLVREEYNMEKDYVYGAAFDETVSQTGQWAFLASGTGNHNLVDSNGEYMRDENGEPIKTKVLYGYRVEVVSYPDADNYMPTLQHTGIGAEDSPLIDTTLSVAEADRLNSDFDDNTLALRPNNADIKLPSRLTTDDGHSVGDLIVLSQLADEDEGSSTPGPYATYEDVNDQRPSNPDEGDEGDEGDDTTGGDTGEGTEPADPTEPTDPENPGEGEGTEGDAGDNTGEGTEGDDPAGLIDPDDAATTVIVDGHTLDSDEMAEALLAMRAAEVQAEGDAADNGDDTDDLTAEEQEMLEKIQNATMEELEALADNVMIFGNKIGEDENGQPIYDDEGDIRLLRAYEARMAELEAARGARVWSDINWYDSVDHDFGLVKIAKAHIAGMVWQDDGYDGTRDESDKGRFANVPVSLERYWYGRTANGSMGWVADDAFNGSAAARTASDGNGEWIFDNLDVAGKRKVNGVDQIVLYGYRVKVDDLPKGYGVTLMNKSGNHETDSDLNEMTKVLDPANPISGMIVLANTTNRGHLAGHSVYVTGPNGTHWLVSEGVDSDFNDTGLVPYQLATIAGVAFIDPEKDGKKDDTAKMVPGQKVYLERKTLDTAAVGFSGASYTATALAQVQGDVIKSDDGWTEVASQTTDADGAYRFEGLPMVDENDNPYIYRVRSTMAKGYEFVPLNKGGNDNNDNDWGKASGSVLGTGEVGITPSMAVLGSFKAVRTEPNAYGQKFNILAAYNWTPEDGRSVDLGMYNADGEDNPWNTVVIDTPWGTKVIATRLPQTGDELMIWALVLAAIAGAALALAAVARRRLEEEEEE